MTFNIAEILKQASNIRKELKEIKKQLFKERIQVLGAEDKVKVVINGNQEVELLEIDSDFFKNIDNKSLNSVILDTINKAIKDSKDLMKKKLSGIDDYIKIPYDLF